MISFRVILILLLSVMWLPTYAFGDLFYTVKQRAAFDFQRATGVVENKQGDVNSVKLNGFFFKGHDLKNKATYWVNDERVTSSVLESGVRLKKIDENSKTVSIQLNDELNDMPLKPGQKIILQQGRISEAFEK